MRESVQQMQAPARRCVQWRHAGRIVAAVGASLLCPPPHCQMLAFGQLLGATWEWLGLKEQAVASGKLRVIPMQRQQATSVGIFFARQCTPASLHFCAA